MIITQEQLENFNKQFKYFLWESEEGQIARDFLAERGIPDINILKPFEVGYCPPDFGYPSNNSLYVDSHIWQMRGRLIVTIRDQYGRIISFAGRIIEKDKEKLYNALDTNFSEQITNFMKKDVSTLVKDWSNSKWINEIYTKSDYLFNLNNAKFHILEKGYAIITEGYLDAIMLAAHGFPNTVALCGVAMSDVHVALLRRYTTHLVYCLDADQAGELAMEKAVKAISKPAIDMSYYLILLPKEKKGLDPDDALLSDKYREIFKNSLIEAGKRQDKNLNKKYLDLSDPVSQMVLT